MRMKALLAIGFAGLLGLSAYAQDGMKHEGMKKDCCKKDAVASADATTGHCDRKDGAKATADCSKDGKCDRKKDGASCCTKAEEKAADKPVADKP